MNNDSVIDIKTQCALFLLACCFGQSEELLWAAIDRAYVDMASHTMTGFSENISLKWKCRFKASTLIRSSIENYPAHEKSFDDWHKNVIKGIKSVYKECKVDNHDFSLTEGQAQKWLNMTIKYLFVIKEILGIDDKRCWEFKHFIEETNSKMYYPPIDSNILKETENNECKRISWSKDIKSNVDYITIKEIMDKKNMNFIWELYNWEQVAKKHRSKPAEDSYAHIFNKEIHKE